MPLRGADWVLAIDFGTTATAAAVGRDGGAELVGLDGGLPRMLSNVFWQESSGRLLLGDVADNASAVAPWCFERSPKLKLGQEYMLLGDHRVRVGDAVGAVLERVASDAIRLRGGQAPSEVRLTHPVRWGEGKREALVEAASVAGLSHPRLILEPVAAAMHYAAQELALDQYVAVYDLGGGTLDVAVLRRTELGFEVVGEPRGREGFGGEEFDHRLYRFLGSQLSDEEWTRLRTEPAEDATNAWPKANRQFQRNVRRAKELLTRNPEVDVDVPSPVNRTLTVSVADLNSLIRRDVEDSAGELERTIRSAGLEPDQLTAVYLAGGSSQIPLVAEVIQQRIGVVPRYLDDCKAVICLGAALDDRVTRRALHETRTSDRTVLDTDIADAAAGAGVAEPATQPADAVALPADPATLSADALTLPADAAMLAADAVTLPADGVRPEVEIPTERATQPEPVGARTDAVGKGETAITFRPTSDSGRPNPHAAVHRRRRATALAGVALLIAAAARADGNRQRTQPPATRALRTPGH
jgi:molecular chaperone DnaK (HSP70)